MPWVAIHVFGVSGPVTVYPPVNGSGDTTLDYVHQFCYVAIAGVLALIWSILDRKRGEYRYLHAWLRIWVRYALAFTLFEFGFSKVFPVQFQPPGLNRLLEPLHDFSPMGLLWTFMGFSPAYTFFAGAAVVLGGMLLLFRRTATLGALVSAAILLNVAMLNFCYDVPVKLFSTNLLLMAIFLAAPDLDRLVRVLLLNQATKPSAVDAVLFTARPVRVLSMAAKTLVIVLILFGQVRGYYHFLDSVQRRLGPMSRGPQISQAIGNPKLWRRMVFDVGDRAFIKTDDAQIPVQSHFTGNALALDAVEFHYSAPSDRVPLTGNGFTIERSGISFDPPRVPLDQRAPV